MHICNHARTFILYCAAPPRYVPVRMAVTNYSFNSLALVFLSCFFQATSKKWKETLSMCQRIQALNTQEYLDKAKFMIELFGFLSVP